MRFKNRYYLVDLVWEPEASKVQGASASSAATDTPVCRVVDPSLTSNVLYSALRDGLRDLCGDLMAGRTLQSLHVRYLNALTSTAIVRCSRDDHRALGATLAFVTGIKGRPCLMRTCHVGGTIRSCQKAALRMQRKRIAELKAQVEQAAQEVGGSGKEAATTGTAAASAASSTTVGVAGSISLSSVLAGAVSRPNQSSARNAQQTLRQLSLLLSQWQGARAAQASSQPASHTGALATQLARGEQAVAPTPAAISAALDGAQAKAEEEIHALEG